LKEVAADAKPVDKGAALLHLLRDQKPEGVEKSFKMAEGSLLADRYLIGIHKADIGPAALFSICERMGMPEKYLSAFKENAQLANAIHFGFEANGSGGIYKVYLEFAARLAGSSPVVLLHVAYKWDVLDPHSCTVARYECHPGLSTDAIVQRLGDLYSDRPDEIAFGAVREIMVIAAGRMRELPMYLEVREEDNPRASFDVNLHLAGIRIGEIGSILARLRRHYSIPASRFETLCRAIEGAVLGHLSGGISRHGKDFVTVYYPVDGA
jgi:hypothetical protein